MEDEYNRRSEFFKFPARKDSEVSYSSSSGVWSFAPAAGTALVPGHGAPLSEDELWGEYDDLIDEVLSPVTSRQEPNLVRSQHPSLEPLPLRPKAQRQSSQSDCNDDEVANASLHLRRSHLLAVLHSTQSPTSSVSFSELISDYGERKISVVDPITGRLASPVLSATRRSTRSSLPLSLSQSARQSRATITSRSSKDRDSLNTNRYRDTRLMEIAETQADGLLSMANLRFGALMTSKWLSFGRVLFSPVHFELKNPSEDRVLVIDGLGKDWSYYCALTYPEATVYDMGPDPSSSTETSSEPWSTLRNHRHICHTSLSKAFPFPMHFFACVVLRFPTALPSSEHRFVLSEAKRVLRPGGYLEFSVLDMDLVNMGNRARRAVRGLKMRMHVADESISLRNISDEIMAGIGHKGFVECNRCVVGVPVAGKLPNPDDIKMANTKRKGSTASSASKTNSTLSQPKGPKPEVSFSDLLNASSSSESTDNGITDMVARVGRWWYSRCYESIVLPEAGEPGAATSGNLLQNSIWRDESLVNECEKRGTSFKLLIGYAQKPEVGVRRTVSV
jgi:SAM-dependent methyltransferase